MNKLLKILVPTLVVGGLAVGVTVFGASLPAKSQPVFGSVIQAGEYNATSTRNFNGVALASLTVLNTAAGTCPTSCPGTFGSVTITGINTGTVNFYDATTSDVNKRTGNTATSSLLVAAFPTNAAVGTYTFDVSLRNGLLYEVTGTAATSTITTR